MAAKNENVTVAEGEAWVRLTDSGTNVSRLTLHNSKASTLTDVEGRIT